MEKIKKLAGKLLGLCIKIIIVLIVILVLYLGGITIFVKTNPDKAEETFNDLRETLQEDENWQEFIEKDNKKIRGI